MSDFRQCVVLTFNLATAGQNDQSVAPFNLNFQPDEVIVKSVSYVVGAPENFIFNVYSNLTEQPIICSFHGSASNSCMLDNRFSLRSYSNRSYNFQVQFTTGVLS